MKTPSFLKFLVISAALSVVLPETLRGGATESMTTVGPNNPGLTYERFPNVYQWEYHDAYRAGPAHPAQLVYGNDNNRLNRANLVFVGDGYRADEKVKFDTDVKAAVSVMFDPTADQLAKDGFLNRYKNFFNVYKVDVVSNATTSGAALNDNGAQYSSTPKPFGTDFNGNTYSFDAGASNFFSKISGLTQNVGDASGKFYDPVYKEGNVKITNTILANHSAWGGSTGLGNIIVVPGSNGGTSELFMHEFGHAFVGLADEYMSGDGQGSAPNVTSNGDAAGAKWANWSGYKDSRDVVNGKSPYDILPNGKAFETSDPYDGKEAGTTSGYTGNYSASAQNRMRWATNGFDAVGREAMILSIYKQVRPLDNFTGRAEYMTSIAGQGHDFHEDIVITETVTIDKAGSNVLFANVVDTSVLKLEWIVEQAGEIKLQYIDDSSGIFDASGLLAGNYRITAHAWDCLALNPDGTTENAPWVRDASALELLHQWVTWENVTVIPEPSTYALIAGALALGLAAGVRRRKISKAG